MLFLAAALHLMAADPAAAPVVHVAQGELAGQTLEDGGAVFRGVPYARPPVGDLRWRDPLPPEAWTGTRAADTFAPACMQTGVSMPGEPPTPVSEDCLYLNVWAPEGAESGGLPVIVWIPGGGWVNGSTAAPVYDGANLARHGAVVVTVAYRLGLLGFLAHPDLTAETDGAGSGNYGLMDQVAALEWVRDNIAAFGGDPANVTIAGQSAGATSVSILMAAPRARGLFHRAIAQSGGLFEPIALAPRYRLSASEAEGVAFAATLGVEGVTALRRISADQITAASENRRAHPTLESRLLPRPPFDVFRAGAQARVPLLLGFNADEARSLGRFDAVTDLDAEVRRRWGALPPALLEPYRDQPPAEGMAAFERDLRFGWDIWRWARLQADSGSPAWLYRFERTPPTPDDAVEAGWRAAHFVELWYMFDNLDQRPWAWTEDDHRLADLMAGTWVRFARTGDPNPPGNAVWPAFTGPSGPVLRLDATPRVGDLPGVEALEAFDRVYDSLRTPEPPMQPGPRPGD